VTETVTTKSVLHVLHPVAEALQRESQFVSTNDVVFAVSLRLSKINLLCEVFDLVPEALPMRFYGATESDKPKMVYHVFDPVAEALQQASPCDSAKDVVFPFSFRWPNIFFCVARYWTLR